MDRSVKAKQLSTILCVFLYLLACISFFPDVTQASSEPDAVIKNLSLSEQASFEISLVTFSSTDALFEWFGHTVLAVENLRNQESFAYSFGGFSFGIDDFLMFTMGKFEFWSYKTDTDQLLSHHLQKGRHVVIQKLKLSPQQAEAIRQHLQLALQPQNRFYVYDHFQDNCATRLRDILNEALDGALKKQSDIDSGRTIRDYIHRMTAHQTLLNFLLQFVLSDGVDQPVSHWETMFLPDRLLIAVQNSINPKTGRPLVSERWDQVPQGKSLYYQEKVIVPHTAGREWAAGLCFGFVILMLARRYLKGLPPNHSTSATLKNREQLEKNSPVGSTVKSYPLVISVFGAVFGLLGVVLFFMAVIGDHRDTFWNENFFLLNPLTFTLLPLGLLKIVGKAERYFAVSSLVCGAAGVVGLLLKLLPAFDQGNGQQIRVLMPVLIVIGITGFVELKRSFESAFMIEKSVKTI